MTLWDHGLLARHGISKLVQRSSYQCQAAGGLQGALLALLQLV